MISDEEYKKLLKQFHKISDRHILVVETDLGDKNPTGLPVGVVSNVI